jgi:hypothetical protein
VSSPRYREGSLIVDIKIEVLLHGTPEETDEPVIVELAEDGIWEVPWIIKAANLEEPAEGVLKLRIRTVGVGDHPPVTTLEELLASPLAEGLASE